MADPESQQGRTGTDADWEVFAKEDPYFAVCTDEAFRRKVLTAEAKSRFLITGEESVANAIDRLHRFFGIGDRFNCSLDFGCGVGRLLLPLARRSNLAIGVDVSATMLEECRQNLTKAQLANARLYRHEGDDFSLLEEHKGKVDLAISFLVFQHIPPERGARLFAGIADLLAPGGAAALNLTFASGVQNIGVEASITTGRQYHFYQRISEAALLRLASTQPSAALMQMNHYNINELLCLLYERGIGCSVIETGMSSGILTAQIYFQRYA